MLAGGSRQFSRFHPRQFNSRQSQLLFQPNSYPRSFSSRQSHQPFMQYSYTPRFRNNQGAPTSTNTSVPICNFCHRRGHTERQCRTKRRQLRSSNSRITANLAYGTDDLRDDVTTMHLYAAIASSSPFADDWYLDTGATHHMTGTQSWLHDCHPVSSSFEVRLGDDSLYKAASKGSLHLRLPNGSITIVPEIYYVPGLTKNLLSVNELTSHGTSAEFQHNYCVIKTPCTSGVPTHLICSKQGKLYPLGLEVIQPRMELYSAHGSNDEETLLWHYRLGHPHVQAMRSIQTHRMAIGFTPNLSRISLCEACIFGKMTRTKFPRSKSKTKDLLELVHSNLCGPMPTTSLTGSSYILTFIDDWSKYTVLYFLKHKSEVLTHFQHYKTFVERQLNKPLRSYRTDNGGKYVSNAFKAYCTQEGIFHQLTVPYTPQQNGVAEQKNCTLLNAVRTMLLTASVSQSFWKEAAATACYVQNRLPTRTLPNKTPYELWTGEKPNISHLRIFGSLCYTLIPADKRHKLSSHAERGILVGCGDRFGIKGYRVYHPTT
ncbi:hypothetical protein L7F22_035753 [Adiantum nelumboides]|nr:hypothetical protein [Adiantum nelumboides]